MSDNRSLHSAIVDYIDEEFNAKPRHIFRLCAMAEKHIPVKAVGFEKGVKEKDEKT
ncbi:hypothetical protein QBC46DRAFT_346750 [Diplogelasinospora grovesii]|uniref:Uncharacterized protein n=1 Tax=Diplogelasinospora grovesii TaxID=303347 RepID=A0AAN6S094_9PEZI|nr:hypothetical protein QBC46DRAFT_346750 [Diplogelasinospora grovesii]